MPHANKPKPLAQWRQTLYTVIYRADTPLGKWFDIFLIACIVCSVVTISLETVNTVGQRFGHYLYAIEWILTVLFTLEYLLRIVCIDKPIRYILSFYGIVDFLSVVPFYLSFLLTDLHYFLLIRILRLLRIFRILKLTQYVSQINILMQAVRGSRQKITVFLFFISTVVVLFGSIMYLVEGPANGFSSIPRSIYWAIVTMTTVGYGDIAPKTDFGQGLAAVVMILGYSIIAVPTGIFTAELNRAIQGTESSKSCPACSKQGHDEMAIYCKFCGAKL